jgi:hypothetical protein
MSTIAAGITSGTALVSTGDTTGALVLKTNGSTTAVTIATNQVVTLAQPLPVASGGTGGSATPTAGGAVYGTGTAYAITSAGTSGQVLQSNGASAPTWVTPSGGLTLGTPVNTTSGTNIDFTGLPSGITQITVSFFGVTLSGSDKIKIQIGDSGGIETTNYFSTGGRIVNTAVTAEAVTTGFNINKGGSGNVLDGSIIITLLSSSSFTYAATGSFADISASNVICFSAGTKELSAELDRIRITTLLGDTFTAGKINIAYM